MPEIIDLERLEYRILGIPIHAVTLDQTVEIMDAWITAGERKYILLAGAHGIVEAQHSADLREIYNRAGLVTADGMPEVWLGKWYGQPQTEKVYAPDIMQAVFAVSAERGYRHYFYGGKEGVADTLTATLRRNYPGIDIVGSYCPPFRALNAAEEQEVTDSINDSGADIVWVGMGCPKQDYWMDSFRNRLQAPVMIGVGAGFDFLSGEKPLAPYWVQRSGFEWLYRLRSEPLRLGRRYLRIIPMFIIYVLLEVLGLRRKNQVRR